MELRQLRYFVAVAEERSITRAAARLHLTQPPLSGQLARLEHELGVRLLHRHRRGVDLTDAGRQLLTRARQLLADVEAAAESVRHLGEGRSGRIVLAFDSATASVVLPRLISRYRAERPAVAIDVVEDTPDGVLEAVLSRRAEIGLTHLPPPVARVPPDARLDLAVVDREPLVAVVPAALADAVGPRVDLRTLADQPFLVPAGGTRAGLSAHVVEACRHAGFEAVLREVRSMPTAVSLIGAGVGVSILPASVRGLSGPEVAVLPLSTHIPVVETALVQHRDLTPSATLRYFTRIALATPEPHALGAHLIPGRGPGPDIGSAKEPVSRAPQPVEDPVRFQEPS
ncbi:LysR family transcriptional regulator [Actinosynnema sp. NPDC050801]|uniref:LysR family transcriptional regulator n=1 Tax=unclassified Actinosynnema TaxID=2637065 RepID=UPI0033C79DEB